MFEKAFELILYLEGKKSNHPNDPGGKTNYGITQKTYDAWKTKKGLPHADVFSITEQEAKDIYYSEYWLVGGCDKLTPKLAVCHFQAVVLLWKTRATKILTDVNNIQNERKSLTEESLCFLYLTLQYNVLKTLLQMNEKLEIFRFGWINRLSKTFKFISNME